MQARRLDPDKLLSQNWLLLAFSFGITILTAWYTRRSGQVMPYTDTVFLPPHKFLNQYDTTTIIDHLNRHCVYEPRIMVTMDGMAPVKKYLRHTRICEIREGTHTQPCSSIGNDTKMLDMYCLAPIKLLNEIHALCQINFITDRFYEGDGASKNCKQGQYPNRSQRDKTLMVETTVIKPGYQSSVNTNESAENFSLAYRP